MELENDYKKDEQNINIHVINTLEKKLERNSMASMSKVWLSYEHNYKFCPYRYYERICNRCLDYCFSYEIINHYYN